MAATAFAILKQRRQGGSNGKSYLVVEGTITVTDNTISGAAVGDMPAAIFGLKKIVGVIGQPIIADNSKMYFAGPDSAGSSLVIGGGAANILQDLPVGVYTAAIIGIG